MKQSVLIVTAVVAGVAAIFIVWRVGFYHPAADRSNAGPTPDDGISIKQIDQTPTPRPGEDPRSRYLSAQERAALREQRREILEKMANMSGEERERLRAEMRERFGSSRPRRSVRFRQVSPEERARRKEDYENTRKRWQNMSEEERKQYLAQMRERGRKWTDLSEEEREKIRADMRSRADANQQEDN